jgi:hypothetical protein
MDLLHQRLQRAPANLAEVPIIVRHEVLVTAGAVDMDASPAQIVVRFTEAAIANKRRFRAHRRLRLPRVWYDAEGPTVSTKNGGEKTRPDARLQIAGNYLPVCNLTNRADSPSA